MSLTIEAPFPVSRGAATALAALGPVALGGMLAARAGDPSPMLAAPAIVFGVVAATGPALYIAMAAAGAAPPLAGMVRAFGVALGAFGLALAGLILPATFVALSSVSAATTIAAASAALAGAGYLGLRGLACELRGGRADAPSGASGASILGGVVFLAWAGATLAIAGRLWWDLAREVVS
ncbi:MAG TPA: hypothetical protein VFT22_45060 [Kofleriaceae bacterium]|nr:hypothetical protein [Kofleriaceae bacterium]